MRTVVLCLAFALAGCSAPLRWEPSSAAVDTELDRWVAGELVPYLTQQLTTHPRFQGEPVMLVPMAGEQLRAEIDGLTQQLQTRIMDELLAVDGVKLVAARAPPAAAAARDPASACDIREPAQYHLALDTAALPGGRFKLRVRALDVVEGTWVSGFGKQWEGGLSRAQRLALEQRVTDEALRGSRALPYERSQADLMAAALAHELGCQLRDRGADDALLHVSGMEHAPVTVGQVPDLVAHHLAQEHALRVSEQPRPGALELQARLHPVDGELHLLSIVAEPGEEPASASVAAEAYLRLAPVGPGRELASPPPPVAKARSPLVAERGLLSPLRLVQPAQLALCGSHDPWRRGARAVDASAVEPGTCVALELYVHRDAELFMVQRRADAELVRRVPASCHDGSPQAYRASRGETLRLPLGRASTSAPRGTNGIETYYVVAVSDAAAATEIERHLRALPPYCARGGSYASAASHAHYADWLGRLDTLMDRFGRQVDWQALRVQHVL